MKLLGRKGVEVGAGRGWRIVCREVRKGGCGDVGYRGRTAC